MIFFTDDRYAIALCNGRPTGTPTDGRDKKKLTAGGRCGHWPRTLPSDQMHEPSIVASSTSRTLRSSIGQVGFRSLAPND